MIFRDYNIKQDILLFGDEGLGFGKTSNKKEMVTSYVKGNEDWFLAGANSTPDEYTLSNGLVNKTVKLKRPKKKELFVQCECQGEILKVEKWEDEKEYFITVYKYSFPYISFWHRIKYAIDVLNGKGISVADVVLSKENFNKIKDFK